MGNEAFVHGGQLCGLDGAGEHSFLDDVRGPLAKADADDGIDAVSDGNDGVEIVVRDPAGDLPRSLQTNFQGFLGCCRLVQFAARVDIFQMQADVFEGAREQFRDLGLRQPHRFAVKTHLYAHDAIRLVDNDLVLGGGHSVLLSAFIMAEGVVDSCP